MKKKLLVILVLLFAFIEIGFCTDYSGCNSAVPAGNHKLTQDVSTSGTCFVLNSSDIIFDCQGYTITGGSNYGNYGFSSNLINNITIKNCIIKNFGSNDGGGISFNAYVSYSNIENITLENDYLGMYLRFGTENSIKNIKINNSGDGIYTIGITHSLFENISINNSNTDGIYAHTSTDNNNFKNIVVENSDHNGITITFDENNIFDNVILRNNNNSGIYISYIDSPARNNTFINSQIYNNTNYNVYFKYSYASDNIFQNSYLGNFSKIGSYNWSQTPNYFYDNTYLPGTKINNGCFDYPLNNTCEQVLPSQSTPKSLSGIFPFSNFTSTLLPLIIVITYFVGGFS